MDQFVNAALRDWWMTIAGACCIDDAVVLVLGWGGVGAVLERLDRGRATDRLDLTPSDAAVGPVPMSLRDVYFRYKGAATDALQGVTLDIEAGELIALLGDNGSG